jgi:hypothetical protein
MMATELEFFLFEQSFRDLRPLGLPRADPDQRLQRGLPHPADHQGRGASCARCATISSRRASRWKTPRARPRPARKSSTSAIRRSARLRRPSHHRQARGQGNRLGQWPFGDLPAEVERHARSARHRMCTCRCGAARSPLPRRKWRLRHVRADAPLHGGPDRVRLGLHLVPGALCEQLQALHEGHLCADPRGLVGRQPHSRFPPVRRGAPRRCASNAASAVRT